MQCMSNVGNYIHWKTPSFVGIEAECEAGRFIGHPLQQDILGPVKRPRRTLKGLDSKALDLCHRAWRAKLENAFHIASDGMQQPVASDPGQPEAEALQELDEAILEFRSLMEQELTQAAMESRSFYGRFDGRDCTFPIFQITSFRAENVAFLLNHHALELYAAGKLSPDVYRPLWFIIQHADLQPWFQEEWLAVLEKTHEESMVPALLIASLRERVELARKRQAERQDR
ncbi:hypothetical protein GCM10007972_23480 [Iodidimonas muriae]|uniref:Uncharacterized protein n=2 Tax=Iodidimonas muriae TaxID=261467 RepID=A0ABQ2LFR0_9PROT|nr:hypothetical protein JCM17843_29210 [Kordiimonadales bacterium JCM 17843]GGO15403.1 hypothetical protein GCM10007972_23480 [Iodidimonas muriae]